MLVISRLMYYGQGVSAEPGLPALWDHYSELLGWMAYLFTQF